MQTLIKQPSETLRRMLNFAGAAAIVEIVAVSAEARGLVDGSAALDVIGSLTAGALFVDMSGGTDGERYLITGKAEDAAGEIHEAEMEVAVVDGQWVMPDGGAPYLTIAEFVDRVGLEETVRMTDDGTGRIDRTMLVGALSAVQAVADVYVSAKYQVPLTTVPDIIKVAITDMARARLYSREAPESIDSAAKAAVKLLERISEGKLPLPSLTPIESAPASAPILSTPGCRQYSDRLKDY